MKSPKTTPGRGVALRRILHPLRRPTLVQTLARDVEHADELGPDWHLEVRLACKRQDMEWELEIWRDAVIHRATDPTPAGSRPH